MRIFITGISGFIGKSLIKRLSLRSNKLLLLAKDQEDRRLLAGYKQDIVTGDLKDIPRFRKCIADFNPEVCIHLAWESIPDFSFDMCKKNLDNSLTLINFIKGQIECKKLIISGTCAEYGRTKGMCSESDNININSFFSWAKYSLYRYSRFICKKSDKDLIWFRIFYAYGSGQRKESLIPSLVRSFKRGVKPDMGNALNANDFIHVEDVAEAFAIAVNKKIKPGIYNLGSGKSTKVIDICKITEKIIRGTTNISKTINLDRGQEETMNFWADINKARKSLNWKPNISLEAGIEDYVKQEIVA